MVRTAAHIANPIPATNGMWNNTATTAVCRETEAASDAYGVAVDLLAVHGRRTDAAVACREWAHVLLEAGRTEQAERVSSRADSLSTVSAS